MQEREVSVAGKPRSLPKPFHVIATQNPIEQEGTYPLPEAQLDRFLMQIDIDYPAFEDEKKMLIETTGFVEATAKQVISADELVSAQALIRTIPVGANIVEDKKSGEYRLSHHIDLKTGMYKGRQILDPKE